MFKTFKTQKKASYDLVGESDADWSGDVNDRKPTAGYYFKLNGCDAALSWGDKKQATVAILSSEAEYQGMAAAVKEELYLKQLLEEFGILAKHPISIGEDDQNASNCAQLSIEIKFHYIRDKTGDWTISIHYGPTDKMASSQNPYPFRRWKHSEVFAWEQTLRNQLKFEWGCYYIDQTIVLKLVRIRKKV